MIRTSRLKTKFWFSFLVILISGVTVLNCTKSISADDRLPNEWTSYEPISISTAEAKAYYDARAAAMPAASEMLAESSTEETEEITALARALQHDPKLIYDYVHNHIDYVPYFGALKGATLTLLDGSGNDFDQASLMIALLRASDITAVYQYGEMTIDGPELANCLGVDQDANVIGAVLASGGIPITTLYVGGMAVFERVWVKANINGTNYLFDPAFKQHTITDKIDLATAIGFNRTDFLTQMMAGATNGTDFVQNLNTTNVTNKLVEYTTNLTNTIETAYPNASVEEIIGGKGIIQENLTDLQVTLPHTTSNVVTWADIPPTHIATLRIQHVGINHTFYGSSPNRVGELTVDSRLYDLIIKG